MIDAYTIGITLSLDDEISQGLASIRNELVDVSRIVDASTAGLIRLRQIAQSTTALATAEAARLATLAARVAESGIDGPGIVMVGEAMGRGAEAADLLPGEQVSIVDVTNGARLETYVIKGERGSGVLGINGAAAHLVHPGDLVIIISYGVLEDAEAKSYLPRVVHVDAANRVVELGEDPAAPAPGVLGQVRGDTIAP